ncbi:hypothetical protein D3C85_1915140 [compost metagenome]
MAEAMAKVSKPNPALGSAAPVRAAVTTPAMPAHTPEIRNTIKVCDLTLIPENQAAWALPPSA